MLPILATTCKNNLLATSAMLRKDVIVCGHAEENNFANMKHFNWTFVLKGSLGVNVYDGLLYL